jgi:D-aminopeptidase
MAQAKLLFKIKEASEKKDGSIIIILSTDAPLTPLQLQRLAKRASVGLSKVGGWGANQSGDVFLAFSTANDGLDDQTESNDIWKPKAVKVDMVEDRNINALFEASADAVEEAILNAVCMAERTVGHNGVVDALDLGKVKELMVKYL